MTPRLVTRPMKGVALAIMAKIPRPGACKTRLVPPLTFEEAAELSTRFLRDTAANLTGVAGRTGASVFAAYTPACTAAVLAKLFGPDVTCVAQRGGDFGARLYNVADELLTAGHPAVCLIDSDSPTVPSAFVEQAVRELEMSGDRVVLGPAIDGGYYLIGIKRPHLALFSGITWSTASVLDETLDAAKRIGVASSLLAPWYDIDDEAGLRLAARELLGGRGNEAGFDAQQTRAFLTTLSQTRNFLAEGTA
jgi:rSAM/selenodomain-associated transferase 1